MSKHAAILQNYNQELAKNIENLKDQRDRLLIEIDKEEEDRMQLLQQIEELNNRLKSVNSSLDEKKRMKDACEKTIREAETGFSKIIESSQVLLTLVQRELEILKF